MIQDKDYTLRLIRQFTSMLSKIILGKNEAEQEMDIRVFETQMKDIFKMDYSYLLEKSVQELSQLVLEKEAKTHADYYELLAHLFYYKWQGDPKVSLAEKSKFFYQQWLTTSKIFSLEIINRIKELEEASTHPAD